MSEQNETLLHELSEKIEESAKKYDGTDKRIFESKEKWEALCQKKDEMKKSIHRMRYNKILAEVKKELVDTEDNNPSGSVGTNKTQMMYFLTPQGGVDYVPMLGRQASTSTTSVPQVRKPFAFSKVNIATSLLGSKTPDAHFESDDKILAIANYEMWKKTWQNEEGNGQSAYQAVTQNAATTGFGAMKTFYRRVMQPVRSGDVQVQRIRFDDVYRISMDPERIWVGVGYSNSDYWSQTEYLYEEDIKFEDFEFRIRQLGIKKIKDKFVNYVKSTLSEEGQAEDSEKSSTHVTITYYENELTNTYLIMCGCYVLYDGELDSPEGYASISTANFLVRDQKDPYGVGLWELCRGSDKLMNHLMFMNAQQVEAEISPIIFATQTGMGDGKIRRGPNEINPKTPGTEIDVVRTTGNPSGSMGLVANESNVVDKITGLTDVVAGLGSEVTLGGTVIAKEAALQRLSIPRNSLVSMLKRDAYVACSFFKTAYGTKRLEKFKSSGALQKFMEVNPTYFVEPQEVAEDGSLIALFSKKVSLPFMLNVDSTNEDGYEFDDKTKATYTRSELMTRLQTVTETDPLSQELIITIDPNSMLQPSDEITQQKVTGLLPMVKQMTVEAIQAAQQDPVLGKALAQQLVAYMEVMKLDLYKWLPKEILEPILAGEMVDPSMQELAVANRMGAVQEQMSKVGVPQQVDVNNLPQTQNSMQDAYNASVGKL